MRLTPAEGALCAGTLTIMVTGSRDGVGCPCMVHEYNMGLGSWLARGRTAAALHETESHFVRILLCLRLEL